MRGTVFIADDDALLVAVVSSLFEAFGYKVLTAPDGVKALDALSQTCPDVILLDALMPGYHGLDLLNLIKASGSCGKVPVVMLTAVDCEAEIVSALRAGAVDYVTKPFRPHELVARVERALLPPR